MSGSTQFLVSHGEAVLFAVVFVEQAGVPLPAAPWLLAAGALSAGGQLNLALAIAITVLACVAADWIWLNIGRRGGQRVLRWFCRLSLAPNACVGRTRGLFERHGVKGLVAAKFIPGLGAMMPPLAGALGISTSRFLLFDGLGSFLYGTFYLAVGFLFHNQIRQALGVLDDLGLGATLVALILVPGYLALKYFRRVRPALRKKAEVHAGLAVEQLARVSDMVLPDQSQIPGTTPGAVGFQNAGLTIERTGPGPERRDAPGSLVQTTLCHS